MARLAHVVAALSMVVAGAEAGSAFCPNGTIHGFPGTHMARCYLYERVGVQFLTAERFCRIAGGHLATARDNFVNTFIARKLEHAEGSPTIP